MSEQESNNVFVPRAEEGGSTLQSTVESRYFVSKHGWIGKSYRQICITACGLLILTPGSQEMVSIPFSDVLSAVPTQSHDDDEFVLITRIRGSVKQDKTTYSTKYRAQLLADLARAKAVASSSPGSVVADPKDKTFRARKMKRNGEFRDVVLAVQPWGLCQQNPISGNAMATYSYHIIDRVAVLPDAENAFALRYGRRDRRSYVFVGVEPSIDAFVSALRRTAWEVVGLRLSISGVQTQKQQQPQQQTSKQMSVGGTVVPADLTRASIIAEQRHAEEVCVLNTMVEFQVMKHSPARHVDPEPRILTLSDQLLVERNPGTYGVVTMRKLAAIDHIVRPVDDPQALRVVYRDGTSSHYTSVSRESLLAYMLDCARASGSSDVFVVSEAVKRGLRMTPLGVYIDTAMEAQIIKALATFSFEDFAASYHQRHPQQKAGVKDAADVYLGGIISTFNANIPYSGPLYTETNKQQKQTVQALHNIVQYTMKPTAATFQALRRLAAVRSVFEAFADNQPLRERLMKFIVTGLQAQDMITVCAALDVVDALMVPLFKLDSPTTDSLNKHHIIADEKFIDALFTLFFVHTRRNTCPLVVLGCVEVLTTMICPPYGDTTNEKQFSMLLTRVSELGRDFFKLFHQSNCLSVVRGAGLIMKALIVEGKDISDLVPKMQRCALVEGATLRHLHAALFTKATTQRQAMFRDLSTQLVSLWVSGCADAEAMLSRALPPSLVYYLESTEEAPAITDEDFVDDARIKAARSGEGNEKNMIVSLFDQWRKPTFPKRELAEIRVKKTMWPGAKKNWAMLFYQFRKDHRRADLIWDNHTREELREALETEMRVFRQEQEIFADGFISWNHNEFIVPYDCLKREVNVNGYYLRLLLNPQPGQKAPCLRNPAEFFDMLFHRCLLEQDPELQALCIQALAVVYKYYGKAIGPFRDVPHLVILFRQCTDRVVRDRMLQLFSVLLAREENAKLFVDNGGVQLLVDLLSIVHYDVDHIVTPAKSNLLTTGADHAEGEWFYMTVTPPTEEEKARQIELDGTEPPPKKERHGPKNIREMENLYNTGVVTSTTLCWANGLEDWKPLGSIIQLRWRLMCTGSPRGVMSSVELAAHILDMLTTLCNLYPVRDEDGGIIRPLPRPKRQLSGQLLFPHIVQILLTFNPVLVDKAALLLDTLLKDNMAAIPKAYLSGLFYFAFLYAGSNVLSLMKIVKSIHLQQHFKEDDVGSATSALSAQDLARRSILGAILPPAMIHLLERHSAEEFTAVYLGNNDTPEAIWNHDMRTLLADRIVTHLGNFLLRLSQNPKAIYQYVPIAPVVYEQLDSEVFCCHYYLRNFCDLKRFPMWPVDNEVEFLQALLLLWSKQDAENTENNVSGSEGGVKMTRSEALETLNLKKDYQDDELRRAYFRMAKEYHPDRNPEGKAVFQKIGEAYRILSTHEDPEAGKKILLLIVRAQSILYKRFKKELSPFKYAGYPLLCSSLKQALAEDSGNCGDVDSETVDSAEIVHACTELCYRTLQSMHFNADELRRQDGLDILCDILVATLPRIFPDTKPSDIRAGIATNTLLSFAAAAAIDACREKFADLAAISRCVVSCVSLTHLPRLVEAALECACCFSLEPALAADMTSYGFIYCALPLLFRYDYTFEEGSVSIACDTTEPDAISPQFKNILAQLSLLALSRLGGLDPASDPVPDRTACLTALLSQSVANLVCRQPLSYVLKVLTTNVEEPLLIWNTACRAEVLNFVEEKQKSASAGDSEFDIEACKNFTFKTLTKELQIGGVFIRVYNEQPATHGSLPDPRFFCQKLLAYIGKSTAQYAGLQLPTSRLAQLRRKYAGGKDVCDVENGSAEEKKFLNNVENGLVKIRMAAEALRNLLRAVRSLDAILKDSDYVRTVFALLLIDADGKTQQYALECINVLTQNADMLACISESHTLGYYGFALASSVCPEALQTLSNMLGNSKIVGDCLAYGTLLHVLRIFTSTTERGGDIAPRVAAASALAKMSADPVHGSRIQIAIGRFLPPAFLATMRQDAEGSVYQFDAVHENPELLWTVNTRTQLKDLVETMSAELCEKQRRIPNALWTLPDDYKVVYDELKNELVLGGVYVRLFLEQPAWSLRNPKLFLEAILTRFVDAYSQASRPATEAEAKQIMEMLLSALNALIVGSPQLADHAARTGHLAKLITLLDDSSLPKQPAAVGAIDALAGSPLCAETLCVTPCTAHALTSAFTADPKNCLLRACDAISRAVQQGICSASKGAHSAPVPSQSTVSGAGAYENVVILSDAELRTHANGCLVAQLLIDNGAVVDDLLNVLSGTYDSTVASDASEVKARVVTALQKACEDTTHGKMLSARLNKSPVWKNYRGQRHDLFLPGNQTVGLLMAGPSGTGGSIGLLTNTASTAQAMSDAPPEMI